MWPSRGHSFGAILDGQRNCVPLFNESLGKQDGFVRALKLGLRAWKDLYDQVWWMLLYLALWWFLTITVVFGPPALLLLFRVADPRQGVWGDRMNFGEVNRYLLDNLVRGWKIWLATVPLVALCIFNLNFYGGSDQTLAVLTPLWLVLLIMSTVGAIAIFAYAAIMETAAMESIKAGVKIATANLPKLIVILLFTLFIPFIFVSTVVLFAYPLTFVFPGVTALAMGRFILDAQDMDYPKPNEPTEELLREKRTH